MDHLYANNMELSLEKEKKTVSFVELQPTVKLEFQEPDPVDCESCQAVFNQKLCILTCAICLQNLTSQEMLLQHLRVVHLIEDFSHGQETFQNELDPLASTTRFPSSSSSEKPQSPLAEGPSTPLIQCEKCDQCRLVFPTPSLLRSHQETAHPVSQKKIKRMKCICGKCEASFKLNVDPNDKSLKGCPNCRFAINTEKAKKRKVLPFQYKCSDCFALFDQLNDLKSHAEESHSKTSAPKNELIKIDTSFKENTKEKEKEEKLGTKNAQNHVEKEKNENLEEEVLKMECDSDDGDIKHKDSIEEENLENDLDPKPQEMKCKKCLFFSDNEEQMHNHVVMEHTDTKNNELNCNKFGECSFTTSEKNAMNDHLNMAHAEFNCPTCNIMFGMETLFIKHVNLEHYGLFKCFDCAKSFGSFKQLQKHQIDEGVRGNFTCLTCSKEFHFKSHLNVHMRLTFHENKARDLQPSIPECSLCKTKVRHLQELVEHLSKEHNLKLEEAYKLVSETNANHFNLHCQKNHCTFLACSQEEMKEHLKQEHGMDLTCAKCDNEFYNLDLFYKHYAHLHGNKYQCRCCGHEYANRKNFSRHIKMKNYVKGQNEEHPPVVCEICGKKFREDNLIIHIRRVHLEKKFKCQHCDFKTCTKFKLKNHIQSRHKGGMPLKFTCEICGKQFGWKHNYNAHKNRRHPEDPSSKGPPRTDPIPKDLAQGDPVPEDLAQGDLVPKDSTQKKKSNNFVKRRSLRKR